jgi:hypothetical protein
MADEFYIITIDFFNGKKGLGKNKLVVFGDKHSMPVYLNKITIEHFNRNIYLLFAILKGEIYI